VIDPDFHNGGRPTKFPKDFCILLIFVEGSSAVLKQNNTAAAVTFEPSEVCKPI